MSDRLPTDGRRLSPLRNRPAVVRVHVICLTGIRVVTTPPDCAGLTMTASDKTILIIEDDRDIAATVQNVLSAAGYSVMMAANGQDGRRKILDNKPDLVLTDMMMPRMGGFPVLEFLSEIDDPPPVIMMTANEGSRHKAYAEMLGVVDYLRKPFAMEVLLESVNRALNPASS